MQELVKPSISVIIPCYNYGKYLGEAVESVLCQDYPDLEIIVVDDGSTDDSTSIAREIIRNNPESQISLIEQKNSGEPAIARNTGIMAARGDYIICLDADDKMATDALTYMAQHVSSNRVVFGIMRAFGQINQDYHPSRFPPDAILYQNQLIYFALYPRSLWEKIGGYGAGIRGYEDWEFWIRAAAAGSEFYPISNLTLLYRKHGSSLIDDAASKHELLYSTIIQKNQELYLPDEVEWANWYLTTGITTLKADPRTPDFFTNSPHPMTYAKLILTAPADVFDSETRHSAISFLGNAQIALSNKITQQSSKINLGSTKQLGDANRLDRAIAYLNDGEYQAAERELVSLLATSNEPQLVLNHLAIVRYALGNQSEAREILNSIVAAYPDDQTAVENLALLFDTANSVDAGKE